MSSGPGPKSAPGGDVSNLSQADFERIKSRRGTAFGSAIALSGNRLVVGETGSLSGGRAEFGAVYVFFRSGAIWRLQAVLSASDRKPGDSFGASVSISGDIVVVGAPSADANGRTGVGAVYVYVAKGTSWVEQTKLCKTVQGVNSYFGESVAVSGDTMVVGDTSDGTSGGAAYVYVRQGEGWTLQASLRGSASGAHGQLGSSVALLGNTALVASFGYDTDREPIPGEAYVFARSGTAWTEQARFIPSNWKKWTLFGNAIALGQDIAVVADAYEQIAYVYARRGMTWELEAKLTTADRTDFDRGFGHAVAVSQDTVVVGSTRSVYVHGNKPYAMHVFGKTGKTWSLQAEIPLGSGDIDDMTPMSAAIEQDTISFGAAGGAENQVGQVDVFVRGTRWDRQARLIPTLIGPGGTP